MAVCGARWRGEPIQGLRDASCYVQQGALAGVIGPTGSGKSTLVKALAGIIPHCTNGSLNGYVRIADMNVKSTTVSDLSLRVGYVGQDPRAQLTSPTVAEEIAFPLENRGVEPDEIEARVDDVLAMLHIEDLRERDTATLSTGEMERVAIGAAIAGEPDVLIVDEPASLLDEEGYEDLVNVIDAMRRRTRMTAVLVEQDTRFLAQRADAVFLMVNGEIIRRTTADIFTRERSLLESVGVIVSDQDATPLVIESDEPDAADNPAVVFNHVHARYADSPPSDAPQLDDVAFAVQQGTSWPSPAATVRARARSRASSMPNCAPTAARLWSMASTSRRAPRADGTAGGRGRPTPRRHVLRAVGARGNRLRSARARRRRR